MIQYSSNLFAKVLSLVISITLVHVNALYALCKVLFLRVTKKVDVIKIFAGRQNNEPSCSRVKNLSRPNERIVRRAWNSSHVYENYRSEWRKLVKNSPFSLGRYFPQHIGVKKWNKKTPANFKTISPNKRTPPPIVPKISNAPRTLIDPIIKILHESRRPDYQETFCICNHQCTIVAMIQNVTNNAIASRSGADLCVDPNFGERQILCERS